MTSVSFTAADGIGRITLDRPEQLNAITVELGTELEQALRSLGSDPLVNLIVISGAGGNFCAGGDFAEVERLRAQGPAALRTLFTAFGKACAAIATLEVPVLAAVEGVAAAGGFELMQAVDVALVSDGAKIADNHIRFGMIPGGGSTQRLPRLIGRQQAMGVLLSGDRLSGVDAVRLGLAYRSFPQAEFEAGVEGFISAMAGRERSALVAIKRLVTAGLQKSVDDGLEVGLGDELDEVVAHISEGAGRNGASAFRKREGSR